MIDPILEFLEETYGYAPPSHIYRPIGEARAWWGGMWEPFHAATEHHTGLAPRRREMYKMGMAKKICEDWAGCHLCVCSDLTKKYERIYRGRCDEVLAMLENNPSVEKGEYCMVCDISMLPPLEEKKQDVSAMVLMLAAIIDEDKSIAEAAEAAMEAGLPRNEVYKAKLKIQDMFEEE